MKLTIIRFFFTDQLQKKKTRATVAKAKGLEPLAQIIIEQKESKPILEIAQEYVNGDSLSEEDKKNNNTEEGGRLFGFSGIDMSNPFYDTLKNSVQTALEAQGDRLMVRDPASNADLQNEQIQELINEGVQAVFLCPVDWEKITPALEALKEADIPVINLDTEVKETSLVSAFVGSDNENDGIWLEMSNGRFAAFSESDYNSVLDTIKDGNVTVKAHSSGDIASLGLSKVTVTEK